MALNILIYLAITLAICEFINLFKPLFVKLILKLKKSKSTAKWLSNYRKNPKYFWGWLIILTVFGLFGFWCPLFYNSVSNLSLNIGTIILQGSLSTFSIVVLLEGILTDRSLPKEQRASFLISSIAMCLIAVHILIYSFTIFGVKTPTIKWVILTLSLAALILAVLLYQYKKIEAEESAEDFLDKEEKAFQKAANASSPVNPVP